MQCNNCLGIENIAALDHRKRFVEWQVDDLDIFALSNPTPTFCAILPAYPSKKQNDLF